MPRIVKPLTAIEIARIVHPDKTTGHRLHPVGTVAGLYLQTTAGGGRSWLLRVQAGLKRREIGLGPYPEVGLAAAHEKARAHKATIKSGVDPIQERRAKRAALIIDQLRNLTFTDAAARYMKSGRVQSLRHEWQRDEWRSTLTNYAVPHVGQMLVEEIGLADVKRVLAPIWREKHATATKVRGRVEAVLAWAIDAGHRQNVTNPATKESLAQWIKDQGGNESASRAAVQIDHMADWFTAVGREGGMAAQALRFLALTAVRVDNVLTMAWDDVDRAARRWVIPAHKMKGKSKDRRAHTVPLSDAALALLDGLDRRDGVALVFPSPRDGELTNAAVGKVMRAVHDKHEVGFVDRDSGGRAVPHGLRSTFKTWSKDVGEFDNDLSEIALSHKVGDATQQAYDRAEMIEKRRVMMDAWAAWCDGKPVTSDNVIPMRRGAA